MVTFTLPFYDKRDNFNITNFPFLSSNIPYSSAYDVFISQLIRYARACYSYECFIVRFRRLSHKLLKQGYIVERWKSSFMISCWYRGICHRTGSDLLLFLFMMCYCRYGDLIKQYEVSLSRMLNHIMKLDQLQWLPNQSDFSPILWHWYRTWHFTELQEVSCRSLAMVLHFCRQCSPFLRSSFIPFWDLIKQIFQTKKLLSWI